MVTSSRQLCDYGWRAWDAGLIAGTCGNLSALFDVGTIIITPKGKNKGCLSEADIKKVGLYRTSRLEEIEVEEGVSVEYPMHRACYLADESVGAVVHTHAPALTALGLSVTPAFVPVQYWGLMEALPEAAEVVGPIEWIPPFPSGSQQLAEAVGEAVADGAKLILLAQHGVVSVGETLEAAYNRMEYGELSARTLLMAERKAVRLQ